jgi:neutral trehalase
VLQGADILSELHRAVGHAQEAEQWAGKRDRLVEAMEAVLWSQEDGIWYDYDRQSNTQRRIYAASNLGKCKNIFKKIYLLKVKNNFSQSLG